MSTKEKEAGRGWEWLALSGKAALRKVTFEQRPGEDGAVSMQDLGKFSAERTDAEVGVERRVGGRLVGCPEHSSQFWSCLAAPSVGWPRLRV